MATRRTTRRAVAAGTGAENDLSAKGPSTTSSLATGKAALGGGKLAVTTNKSTASGAAGAAGAKLLVGKSTGTTTLGTGIARKRSAFTDVTNGAKKSGTTIPIATKPTTTSAAAPAQASSTTTRRSYRTRSSTGGSAIKLDGEASDQPSAADEDEGQEDEDDEDAMAIDQPVAAAVAPPRQIKQLRRTSVAVASTSTASKGKLATSTTTTAAARRPLATKRTNSAISVSASEVPIVTTRPASKATLALRARQRREQAEKVAEQAKRELEEAVREEQEAQHRSKKARTSEPEEFYVEEEEEEELEEEEEEGGDFVEVDAEVQGGKRVVREVEVERDAGWEDLDEGDEDDPLMVSAYVVEVYEYLRELELTTMPDTDYMANQNEVTWKMRGILIDWLIEIHTKFRLLPETIFLATNIIDRFLSTRVVSLVKFQLVGVTALFIAAKYEEVVCPSVTNFLYMTDGGYNDDEILKAERYVLSMIDFNLSYPNPINFLRRISKADGYDIQSRTMAKYLMEISIVDHKFMGVTPSLIAAAGNWLARKVLDKGEWDANLVHYSGYTESELKPTAQLMLDYVVRSSPILSANEINQTGSSFNPLMTSPVSHEVEHPNFIKKYAAKKFFKASTQVRKWAEDQYAPINSYNPKTRKTETLIVPALL